MPCSFGFLPDPRSRMCTQPTRLLGVTMTVRWIPLVSAPCGTRVVRPARTTMHARAVTAPAWALGEACPASLKFIGKPGRRRGSSDTDLVESEFPGSINSDGVEEYPTLRCLLAPQFWLQFRCTVGRLHDTSREGAVSCLLNRDAPGLGLVGLAFVRQS